MEKLIKWFDLERFGAAIRVIPESPLRGIATTCLEINDRKLYESSYGFSEGLSFEKQQALASRWSKDKKTLGFADTPETLRDSDGVIQQLRFHSMKTQFSMSELKALFPALEPSDHRDMPVSEIALSISPEKELTGHWQAFAKDVLAKDAVGVWTPVENPFGTPYHASPKITEVDPSRERKPFALLEDNSVSRYYGLADKLDRANYRANALIPYYASIDAATADGWDTAQLQQVDMPYVLPLWVTEAGKVIGLRDVRFAPEIMDLSPDSYYKSGGSGLIIGAIRDAESLSAEIAAEVSKWHAWAATPNTLDGPDHLWGSITRVVSSVEELRQRHPRLNADARLLSDGAEASRGGAVRAKPLHELQDGDMRLVVLTASRFVPIDDDERAALSMKLVGLLKHAHALIADQAAVQARESLRAVTELFRVATDDPDEPKIKHVDTGEKIGGARKDYGKRALALEDLDSMNEMERTSLVTKKNVWPPLNYVEMRESGVTPQAAVCLKYLKDKLNTTPVRAGRSLYQRGDSDFDADYIGAIELVRDAVVDVRTVDDFLSVMAQLYERGRLLPCGDTSDYVTGGTALQVQWGREAANTIYSCNGGLLSYKLSLEVSKKVGRSESLDDQWKSLIKPKREKSQSEIEATREKLEQDRELHRPHLDKVQREGTDWRANRDITANDLIEHFGFRAVEFGNWLPQDERQQVLNMAFDSFCDLSQALGLTPKDLSLDGDLAIAFGSRGFGGKVGVMAHFEPARMVINLTRMQGAGSLAHEWCHALDFHLGEKKGYASVLSEKTNSSVIGELSRALKLRLATGEEAFRLGNSNAQKGQDYALSWVPIDNANGRQKLKEGMAVLFDKAHTAFYESAGTRLVKAPNFSGRKSAVDTQVFDDLYLEMMGCMEASATGKPALFTKVRDKITNCVIFSLESLARAVTAEVALDTKLPLPESFLGGGSQLPTDFSKEATKLDKSKAAPYWGTTHEMFARAGAAFVHDQLEAVGTRSDYLVYGADEGRYKDHPIGNPNPAGNDRKVIEEHFLRLMTEYRLRCMAENQSSGDMEP